MTRKYNKRTRCEFDDNCTNDIKFTLIRRNQHIGICGQHLARTVILTTKGLEGNSVMIEVGISEVLRETKGIKSRNGN